MSGKANQLTFQKNFIAQKVRDEVKLASGDLLEMKRFEPAMRHLLDMYIRADDSEVLMDFEDFGLIDLVVNNNGEGMDKLPKGLRDNEDAMAEAIENNVRKTIVSDGIRPEHIVLDNRLGKCACTFFYAGFLYMKNDKNLITSCKYR